MRTLRFTRLQARLHASSLRASWLLVFAFAVAALTPAGLRWRDTSRALSRLDALAAVAGATHAAACIRAEEVPTLMRGAPVDIAP